LARWAAATAHYDRLLVTDEPDYEEVIRNLGVPVVLHEAAEHPTKTGAMRVYGTLLNSAWKAIIENAEGYTHILSLESDVIPDGDIVSVMEEHYDPEYQFLRHGVPWREAYEKPPGRFSYELGCTLASVQDWKKALAKTDDVEPTKIYTVVGVAQAYGLTAKNINVCQLEHLDNGIDSRF